MKILILFFIISCSSYTDPDQERLIYYKCDQKKIVTTKHSDDYQTMTIRYNGDYNISLHHFVSRLGSGYRNENFLWITKGELSVLVEKQPDGSDKIISNNCKAQK